MIITKKCRIKNWDESNISPLQMIRDRILIDQNNINFVVDQLNSKKINKRFHDEPKRIINTLIRTCHGSLGMYASTNTGCLYYEDGTFKKETTVEHTVPVSKLIDLYLHSDGYKSNGSLYSLGFLLFFPVCLLSKSSNEKLKNFSKTNEDIKYPFRRYQMAGIDDQILDHTGRKIDLEKFTIRDHFALVEETSDPRSRHYSKEFSEVFNHFKVKDEYLKFIESIQV